jgi:hypothetical protein
MPTFLRASVLLFVGIRLPAQQLPYPTYLNPKVLYAGGDATSLAIYNQSYAAGLTAFWNGAPRATTFGSNNTYTVALTGADLASLQLAQITMVDAAGAVVDTVNCAVVYNLQPQGIALDATRNRLYLATPAQTGDPRFPPSSVAHWISRPALSAPLCRRPTHWETSLCRMMPARFTCW